MAIHVNSVNFFGKLFRVIKIRMTSLISFTKAYYSWWHNHIKLTTNYYPKNEFHRNFKMNVCEILNESTYTYCRFFFFLSDIQGQWNAVVLFFLDYFCQSLLLSIILWIESFYLFCLSWYIIYHARSSSSLNSKARFCITLSPQQSNFILFFCIFLQNKFCEV